MIQEMNYLKMVNLKDILLVRGPWVLQKYFKAEKDAVDQDGWFDTGDISVH